MTHEQEWRKLILSEIRDLRSEVGALTKEVNQLSSLKVRVAGISTVITAFVSLLVSYLTK